MYLAIPNGSGGVIFAPVQLMPTVSNTPIIKKGHCRFCAQEEISTELIDFADNAETTTQLLTIFEFFKIDYVNILDLKLPKTSCKACYDEIFKCYKFFQTVKASQEVLKRLYGTDDEKSDKMLIKSEPVDCLDFEDIKQENITENETFSQTTEYENNLFTDLSSQTENSDFREKYTVPIECMPDSALKVDDNKIKKINLESTSNSKLECKPMHIEEPSFKSDGTLIKTRVNKEIIITNNFNNIELIIENNIDIEKNISPYDESATARTLPKEAKIKEFSWNDYPWHCRLCQLKFDRMQDLSFHSLRTHKYCFAYKCADCTEDFNMFHPFIEHVRRHRYILRFFCPYCNKHYKNESNCMKHETNICTKWAKICDWCGKLCHDEDMLRRHKSIQHRQLHSNDLFNKNATGVVPRASSSVPNKPKTWENYEWGCLECSLPFETIAALRAHSQVIHNKCFVVRCADCFQVYYNYPHFAEHVVEHRPYLRKYCPYCNQQIKDANKMKKHAENHFTGLRKVCSVCGQMFQYMIEEKQHLERFQPKRGLENFTTEE